MNKELMSITDMDHTTNMPSVYAEELTRCMSLDDLRVLAVRWHGLASDITPIIEKMSDADFVDFQLGMLIERNGGFAGPEFAERYGTLLMPDILVVCAGMAHQNNVPWGVAFGVCVRKGIISITDGVAKLQGKVQRFAVPDDVEISKNDVVIFDRDGEHGSNKLH